MHEYNCLNCHNPIIIVDEINVDEVTCPKCKTMFDVVLEEDSETFDWWFYLEQKPENKKHICFEASHIECSCKDKCLRNINNYK